jgi:hypothetical protein
MESDEKKGAWNRTLTPRLRLVECTLRVRGASLSGRGAYPPGMSMESVEKKGAWNRTERVRGEGSCPRQSTNTLASANGYKHSSSSNQCLELSGLGFRPSRRGWGVCPARVRPSWCMRGACPLHDLTEVNVEGKKKNKEDARHASANASCELRVANCELRVRVRVSSFELRVRHNTSECINICECDSPPSLLHPPHTHVRCNCRVRGCPHSARLGIRPARARPSWIIGGACPLHNLMEVRE